MNTSISGVLSSLPLSRQVSRVVRHRWPALAVGTVAAAFPLVALASVTLDKVQDFGPGRFHTNGTATCLEVTVSEPCAAVTAVTLSSSAPAISAMGPIEADGAFGNVAGDAIRAVAKDGTGLVAKAWGTGTAVVASAQGVAVKATSVSGSAVFAQGNLTAGSFGAGVLAQGDEAVIARGVSRGVEASAKGDAVSAISDNGVGGFFAGKEAPIRMGAASTPGAPTTGVHHRGELYVDSNGLLFYCTADGTPGSWHQIAFKN